MKKGTYFIIVIVLVFAACQNAGSKKVDIKAERDQVKALLDQYVVANEQQNFKLIESIWAGNEDIILIGTDSDEKLKGWSQIKKAITQQFKHFSDTYIVISEQNIRVNDQATTAWFSQEMNYNFIYKDEAKKFSGIRFTGVLDKIDGQWKMVQGHLSIPEEAELEEVY